MQDLPAVPDIAPEIDLTLPTTFCCTRLERYQGVIFEAVLKIEKWGIGKHWVFDKENAAALNSSCYKGLGRWQNLAGKFANFGTSERRGVTSLSCVCMPHKWFAWCAILRLYRLAVNCCPDRSRTRQIWKTRWTSALTGHGEVCQQCRA